MGIKFPHTTNNDVAGFRYSYKYKIKTKLRELKIRKLVYLKKWYKLLTFGNSCDSNIRLQAVKEIHQCV